MNHQPDDPIRARLTAQDPLHRQHEPHPAEPPAHLLEQIMNTPVVTRHEPPAADLGGRPNRSPKRRWAFGGAGLGAAAVAGIIALSAGGGGSPAATSIELDLGAEDIMASCLPVEAQFLDDMPMAFAATVASVEGEIVTLDVTRWYVGGDADQVVLRAPDGMQALIGGITFEAGQDYLVSATDGVVNYCGYSGLATPELQAIFDAAFPG